MTGAMTQAYSDNLSGIGRWSLSIVPKGSAYELSLIHIYLRLTARRREGLIGLFFLAPFLIGTLLCFAFPTISSFLLSFGATDTQTAGFHIQMTGLENYSRDVYKRQPFSP